MNDIYKIIAQKTEEGKECVIITVVEKKGHGPSEVGKKMVVTGDSSHGTIGGGTLELLAVKESKDVLKLKKSRLKRYLLEDDGKDGKAGEKTGMMCGGEVLLFFEYIGNREQIFIFGAGHIGKYLIKFAENLDYGMNVFDTRKDILGEISGVNKVFIEKIDGFFSDLKYMENGFVLIATHSHELDYKILRGLVDSGLKLKYLGMIASKKKLDTMIGKYKKERGRELDTSLLHSPAGLNIGGAAPAEIALSVLSEIQSVRYGIKETIGLSEKRGIPDETNH